MTKITCLLFAVLALGASAQKTKPAADFCYSVRAGEDHTESAQLAAQFHSEFPEASPLVKEFHRRGVREQRLDYLLAKKTMSRADVKECACRFRKMADRLPREK